MSSPPPPGRPGALADAGGIVGRAAVDSTIAFATLVAVGQLLAGLGLLLIGVYGLWSWVKIGLLTVLLSLRADVLATVEGPPILRTAAGSTTIQARFVPMALTIGFLWLAARGGRRAARRGEPRSGLAAAGLAAAGAAVPVAILSAVGASLVTLSFPSLGIRIEVDAADAALWAGSLAAAGAGAGAYLEAARGRPSAAALRGGITGYGWALGLLAVGIFVVATLEPTVTRRYVDGLTGLGAGGGLLFGAHVLAVPAQSALLAAPASGSCLEIVGEGSIFRLCPWRFGGHAGGTFLSAPLPLAPSLWVLSAMPGVAAMLGGRSAAVRRSATGRRAAGLGAATGLVFASLVVVGGWFAAFRFSSVLLPGRLVWVHPAWARTALAALIWGVAGGAMGAWLAGRAYEEPGLPIPTSA
ncbi:MAG TPA: hypothetical protein VF108_08570 [Actinomycetota bacterium]